MDEIWKMLHGDEEFIPQELIDIKNIIEPIVWNPSFINLIRFRQIDFETILDSINLMLGEKEDSPASRYQFVCNVNEYMESIGTTDTVKNKVKTTFIYEPIYNYIHKFNEKEHQMDVAIWYNDINLADDMK